MKEGIKCIRKGCEYSGKECKFWNECVAFLADREEDKKKNTQKDALRPTENNEQIIVAQYCRYQHIPFVHVPNEGLRSKRMGALLKEMGMQKGFPDIHIPQARGGYHAMYIELKRDKLAHPTKEQLDWIAYLNKNGYYAVVAYGADAAIAEIKKYMGIR